MNSCPYCGESLADGAVQCSRCGMMLDGGDAPDEFDGPAAAKAPKGNAAIKEASARAAAAHKEPPKKKTFPCPKCDKPVKETAHRCPSCGHKIRDVISQETRQEEAQFQRYIRLGVLGVIAAVLLFVGFLYLTRGDARQGKVEYAKASFTDVASMVGPSAKGKAERQAENWQKLVGKWVRWEGRCMDIDRGGAFGDAALLLRHREGKGGADVRLTLPKAELDKPGVHIGAKVSYEGKLESYESGDPPFLLSGGLVKSAKD